MKAETFHFELITPCFCGGASPKEQAEIRAPSIRGQLRWWFRTLGGFKSLAPLPTANQEAMIFGSIAGDKGQAGKLILRTIAKGLQTGVKDGQELGHPNFSDPAFLTFPVQSRERAGQVIQYAGRGVIISGSFDLTVIWRGDPAIWADVKSLIAVFGHLGSLGFRGRRAMGAFAFVGAAPASLAQAIPSFSATNAILVKQLPANSAKDAVSVLGAWLKSCRAHGRSGQNLTETQSSYFKFAKRDHDIGYEDRSTQGQSAFRPALGLPIIQRTSKGTNTWNWNWNQQRRQGEGRFASPVLLRPHKDAQGKWHALIIFVDAHKWPNGKQAFLNSAPRTVSLDLYDTMKNDPKLTNFP